MSYIITKTDGTLLPTTAGSGVINDGTIDNSTSLSLPGPNYVGYGQFLNENLVKILESFAGNSAPSGNNLEGQLWFNKSRQQLNVFTKNGYSPVSGVIISGSQPVNVKSGDVWYNGGTGQFYIYDGLTFNLIGPVYTKSQKVSGAIPVAIPDSLGNNHNILQLQYGDTVFAVISSSPPFAPAALTGFPLINPGITFNNSLTASINTNIVGGLTGNVVGNLTGNFVTATNLTGTLTGNVVGNLNGLSVTATNLVGSLTGTVNSPSGVFTNLSTGNAVLAGGYVSFVSNVYTPSAVIDNFSTGNAVVTSGSLTGITELRSTDATVTTAEVETLVTTNFSTANAQIAGGSLSGITHVNTTTLYTANLSVANALVSGGNINNIGSLSAGTANFQTVNTSAITISGGNVLGLTNLGTVSAQVTNFSTGNARISGGNIVATPIFNANITNANLVNATTATPATNNRTTALATTAFVHNVMPTGMIIMWGGLVSAIPAGWALCDGTNGTPDLRGQFIIGAGGAYNTGDAGGNSTLNLTTAMLPAHTHSFSATANTTSAGAHTHSASTTITDPTHTHNPGVNIISSSTGTLAGYLGGYGSALYNTQIASASTSISAATSVTSAATHLHSVTVSGNTSQTGAGQSIDIRPPYYALCYLQKVY